MILSGDWEPTYHMSEANFSDLLGKVVVEYQREQLFIAFKTSENEIFVLAHEQCCCESVFVEDVVGDLDDLLNVPILNAEESGNSKEDSDKSFFLGILKNLHHPMNVCCLLFFKIKKSLTGFTRDTFCFSFFYHFDLSVVDDLL